MTNNQHYEDLPVFSEYTIINQFANRCYSDLHCLFPSSSHLVVFMGLSINPNLVTQIKSLHNALRLCPVKIAIMDRNDLNGIMLPDEIIIIPFKSFSDDPTPKAFRSENHIINEFNALQRFLESSNLKFNYISRFRKDSIMDVPLFIDFLMSIPSFFSCYTVVISTSSTNALRRFCLSDVSYSFRFSDFMSLSLAYRTPSRLDRIIRRLSFVEMFSTTYQAEQFIWKQILRQLMPDFLLPMHYHQYLELLCTYVYFPSPHQVGVYFSRNNDVLFSSWNYFSTSGSGLFSSTRPYRDFFTVSSICLQFLFVSEGRMHLFVLRFFSFATSFFRFSFRCILSPFRLF